MASCSFGILRLDVLLIESISERKFHHQQLNSFTAGGRHQRSRSQCVAQFGQILGMRLNRLRASFQLIVIPTQVFSWQIQQGAKAALCIAVVWISRVIQGFQRRSVARLPFDQLTAAAGHHPAGVFHGCRCHHQAQTTCTNSFPVALKIRDNSGITPLDPLQ